MSSIQEFYLLPEDIQQEILDFMSFVAKRKGIKLDANKTQVQLNGLKK